MAPLTLDHWIIVILAFVLGLVIGMFLFAGGKWKRRYREEVARREALASENATLRKDAREMETLRAAAARSPARDPRPGPL